MASVKGAICAICMHNPVWRSDRAFGLCTLQLQSLASRAEPGRTSTFSLRTPARPNPIGTQIVKLLRVDGANVFVRGLDCLNGTPLLDLKPDRCAFTPLAPRQPGDDQVGDPE